MPRPLPAAFARRFIIGVVAVVGVPAWPLKLGSTGERVRAVQRALHQRADGRYGRQTADAVRRFQTRHRLIPDGKVGPATWAALERAAHTARPDLHGEVVLLQRRLRLPADGVFGPATLQAVKRLQRRHGLIPDGVVGPATWRALGVHGPRAVLRAGGAAPRPALPPHGVPGAIRLAIAGADRIARAPYRYGGGHRSFNDSGYDCSGSVSYVLHVAGLLTHPLDSAQLMSWGVPGPGRWMTVYANPGHTFLVIGHRRFDTSGAQAGSRWQLAARSTAGYMARHAVGL